MTTPAHNLNKQTVILISVTDNNKSLHIKMMKPISSGYSSEIQQPAHLISYPSYPLSRCKQCGYISTLSDEPSPARELAVKSEIASICLVEIYQVTGAGKEISVLFSAQVKKPSSTTPKLPTEQTNGSFINTL